ncbi:MAG: DUF4352 domain-containing protein [Chloroflexota bacterium]
MVPRIQDSSSDRSIVRRFQAGFGALPRRARFGLPAVVLLLVGVVLALTTSSSSSERQAGSGSSGGPAAASSPAAGGGARAAASPSTVALFTTPTRAPLSLGEITPIPNRGVSPTPTPSAARPGEALRLGDYSVTLLDTRDPVTSVYTLVQPTQGNRFVALEVQITNNSSRVVPYSYLHFRLRDTGGNELRATASTTIEPTLQSGNLSSRETVSGWITFMPRSVVDVEMLYFQAPGMIGPRGQFTLR